MKKKVSDEKEMRIRELVAENYIKGLPKCRISQKVSEIMGFKVTLGRVNKALDGIFDTWREKGIMDKVLMRSVELTRIDTRESELWQAWEHSKRTEENGDARYLAELRRCSEQRTKLLGLELAPDHRKKTPPSQEGSIVWMEKKTYESDQETDPGAGLS